MTCLGYDLQRLCFEGPEDELRLTQHAQPAILVHSIATWTLVSRHGLRPVLLAGHSLGEYSALVASGVLRFADAVRSGAAARDVHGASSGTRLELAAWQRCLGVARQDVRSLWCRAWRGRRAAISQTTMTLAKSSLPGRPLHGYRLP